MHKVVLDTNVLVSAFWSSLGSPFRILEMFFEGELALYYNDDILAEYAEVMHREKLGFSDEKVLTLVAEIETYGIKFDSTASTIPFIDEDDRKFYDIATASGAVVVTGNKRHFPDVPIILTPAEFLKSIEPLSQESRLT